jgi:hypothetical protein
LFFYHVMHKKKDNQKVMLCLIFFPLHFFFSCSSFVF